MAASYTTTDALADYLLEHGLAKASLRPMAKAAGTSDRMLIYHYGSKAGVLEAALMGLSERLFAQLDARIGAAGHPSKALAGILDALSSEELRGYSALWQDVVAGAMRGDPLMKRTGAQMVESYIPWLADQLPNPEFAALTLAVIDGVAQMQAVGRDEDVRAALVGYLQLLGA